MKVKKEKLLMNIVFQNFLLKKELVYKQNQNYHIDLDNPTFFVNYLKFNREIHMNGLIGNIVFLILIIIVKIISGEMLFTTIALIFDIISLLVNFECVNLQNYNLCRLENVKMKELLQKRETKIKEEKIKKYGEGMKVIGKTFKNTDDVPSFNDILDNVKTDEEKIQLLSYLKKQLEILEKQNDENNIHKGRCKVK